jgi:hypothetical protein
MIFYDLNISYRETGRGGIAGPENQGITGIPD